MTLEKLQALSNKALKENDKIKRSVLVNLIAQIKKVSIDERCVDNVTEELCNRVILKEKKVLQEQIDTCPESHKELKEEYVARMSIYDDFAPKLIDDEDEIREIIMAFKEQCPEIDYTNKGVAMRYIMPALKGKVDLKVASKVITELCK